MTTYVIRPTTYLVNTGGLSSASNATILAALNDNSDATTITTNVASAVYSYNNLFGLATPSIASTEFPVRVGGAMRYSGGSPSFALAAAIYKSGETWSASNIALTGSGTLVTSEPYLRVVRYTNAECAGLQFNIAPQRSSGSTQATIADIWANVYTISKATAAVSPVTMTTSAYAVIPVTATIAMDWEATASDANLRRVIYEVRVESGGSGVGTGTLRELTGTRVSAPFAGGGSITINITLQNALANGTYNVYARAVRFRENQSDADAYAATDQTSAWVSTTLTMNNPLPTAPGLTAIVDQTFDRIAVGVTPVATSGHTSPKIDIERSDDAGVTYTPVRGATGLAGTFGTTTTVYDYECSRANNLVQYRARVNTTYTGGITLTSNWTTQAASAINAPDWNIKCPENFALNLLDAQIIDKPTEELTEDIGVFRTLDRRFPVTVSGVLGGWDGELNIVASSAAEWASLKALLEAQKVLLLESPFGWSKYIRITSGAKVRLEGSATAPRRYVDVSYVETSAP